LGVTKNIDYPDIVTKEKAQAFIGLDIPKEKAAKQKFIKEVVPEWLKKAASREKKYKIKNI